MIVNKQCESCGVVFQYDENPQFPRKYCPNCSEKKKAEYKATKGQKAQPVAQIQPNNAVIGVTEGISVIQHEFKNTTEFGPANNRHKVYWKTIEELKERMKELEEQGFLVEVVKM